MARKKASDNKVVVGNIHEVSGKVTIAGGDIYAGYTVEQVSFLLKEITTSYRRKPFDGRCPYKGLEVFEEEDADLFFGRERLVEDLVSRIKESRTVFVTGPSGSGKSSLVRAGLIHALKDGALRGSDRWLYETMKPGREPIKELSLAFSRLKGPELTDYFLAHAREPDVLHRCAESVLSGQKTQRFVLFIDQFEEVFTQISGEEERQAFIHMLAHAGTVENGRVIVLFAMRSDFVSNCATYPALNELLSQEFRQIGAMQPEELVAAIALPAKEVGLPIEDELIARIINDMKGEPGALPLMQFALKELFEAGQAKGGATALTLKEYLEREGIQKMLARHADDTLNKLNENQQELARSIFSGLIEIGRGTTDTKRTALFDELVPANASSADVLAIVQKLADARLIITDEQAGKDTVTISHEKLIEAWPWLKKLVDENRDVIALQNEISGDAKEWDEHQRDPSYLFHGARLANAREQLATKMITLSGLAQLFIDAGAKAHADELESAKQKVVQLRQRALYLSIALLVALIAVGTAVFLGVQSEQQAKISRAGELAAQSVSLRDRDFQLSLLLGIEAYRSTPTIQSSGVLLDNAQGYPQLRTFLNGHTSVVNSVAFSPDGETLASGSRDNTIILWDVATHQPIGQPFTGHTGAINSVAFSSDGKMLASGSQDSTIILWNVATGQPIGQPLTVDNYVIQSVVFSPDGKTLASSYETQKGSVNIISSITLWDVATGQPIGQLLTEDFTVVTNPAFSPDGKTLASVSRGDTIILWDVATLQPVGQPLTGFTNGVDSLAFSPDGKILAASSCGSRNSDKCTQGAIILWNVTTGQPIEQTLTGHTDRVISMAFSLDGETLVTGSYDSTIILWNVATHQPIGQSLTNPAVYITSVAFSPDGKTLASSSNDKTVILWDIGSSEESIGQPLMGFHASGFSVAFSPDGKILAASGGREDSIILWDVVSGKPIGQPLATHSDQVYNVTISPDGRTLASNSENTTIILWSMATGLPIGQLPTGHTDNYAWSIAFSPDGKTLASGNKDGTIILWDVATRQPIGQPLKGQDWVTSVAFSPDGRMLASASVDETIILWNVSTGLSIGQPLVGHTESINSLVFSPNGKTLASASDDNTVILWEVTTGKPIGQPLTGHINVVHSVAFSPDGKILASGSEDMTIILWDVAMRQPIGQPLTGYYGGGGLAFSPVGKTIASSGTNQIITLWDIDPQSWVEKSCQRVGRNFTRAEWTQYFPDEEYRATCPQWPLESEATATPTVHP